MKPIIQLREFSTDQLIEELARRRNASAVNKPREWCEDCAHFRPWIEGDTPEAPTPADYNPCRKGHVMRFRAPEEIDEEYGFYRTVCPDRTAR